MATQDEIIARKRIREILANATYTPPIINFINLSPHDAKEFGDRGGKFFNKDQSITNDARIDLCSVDEAAELTTLLQTLGYRIEDYYGSEPPHISFHGKRHSDRPESSIERYCAEQSGPEAFEEYLKVQFKEFSYSWTDKSGNEEAHKFELEFGDDIMLGADVSHIANAKSQNTPMIQMLGGDPIAELLEQAQYNPERAFGPRIKFVSEDPMADANNTQRLCTLLQEAGYNAEIKDEIIKGGPTIIRLFPAGVDGVKAGIRESYEPNGQADEFETKWGAHLNLGEDFALSMKNINEARSRGKS